MILHFKRGDTVKKLVSLFWTMFKIGLFTFGGGYAMIALLEGELVGKREWIDKDEFLDMVAIAESTPGPIAINAATYVGYRTAGFLGALLATLAICLPSFGIIFTISLFFDAFLSIAWVAAAFRGIKLCVILLILTAGLRMLKKLPKTPFNLAVLILTAAVMLTLSLLAVQFSAIFYILISGVLGLVLFFIGQVRKRGEKK
jgi:chromate transporter